jgi:nucleolar protein 56
MKVHLAENALGVFAFQGGRLVAFRTFEPAEAAERIREMQAGLPTPQHLRLVEELVGKGYGEFWVEEGGLAGRLGERFPGAVFRAEFPGEGGRRLRGEGERIALEVCGISLPERVREVSLELARGEVGRRMAERDRSVVGASRLLEEVDRSLNLLVGLLREWYSLHFPELGELVGDHERYLRLLVSLGGRGEFREERLVELGLTPEEASRISAAARSSLGAGMGEEDLERLRESGRAVLELLSLRRGLAEYLDRKMEEVAPNLRAVVGSLLAARLLSLAGGLERLARMPASTIQVLGAEKALFRALRSKGKPPKHGVIYRFPPLRSAPKKLRGKIARAVAGKVSIAARVDLLGGGYLGERLSSELERRLEEIRRGRK